MHLRTTPPRKACTVDTIMDFPLSDVPGLLTLEQKRPASFPAGSPPPRLGVEDQSSSQKRKLPKIHVIALRASCAAAKKSRAATSSCIVSGPNHAARFRCASGSARRGGLVGGQC